MRWWKDTFEDLFSHFYLNTFSSFFSAKHEQKQAREKERSKLLVHSHTKKKETKRERNFIRKMRDNGWVIYDRLPQLAHAFLPLFRKSALYCRVKFHMIRSRAAKGGGISEKLLKYWTCVKSPNLEFYFMLFLLFSYALFLCLLLSSFRGALDRCLLAFQVSFFSCNHHILLLFCMLLCCDMSFC